MPIKITSDPAGVPAFYELSELKQNDEKANGAMSESEFDEASKAFDDHFRRDTGNSIKEELAHFDLGQLLQHLPEAPVTPNDLLIVVHYGLKGDKLRYGFSFHEGQREANGDLTYGTPSFATHLLENGLIKEVEEADWAAMRLDYVAGVNVKRTSDTTDTFKSLVVGQDAERVVFPWRDELFEMYKANVADRSGPFRVVMNSISMVHPLETHDGTSSIAGHRHGVAFYMEELDGVWGRLLSDTRVVVSHLPKITNYRDRAADYGNLCPVRCGRYTPPQRSFGTA